MFLSECRHMLRSPRLRDRKLRSNKHEYSSIKWSNQGESYRHFGCNAYDKLKVIRARTLLPDRSQDYAAKRILTIKISQEININRRRHMKYRIIADSLKE